MRNVDGSNRRDYRGGMGIVRLRRLSIALVAAYAMALQALLTAFIPLPPAAFAESAVLCSPSDTGEGAPLPHDGACSVHCAVLGHGASAGLPPPFAAGIAAPPVQTARLDAGAWRAPRLAARGSSSPRGPPLV